MAASSLPARIPERQPDPASNPRPTWPRLEKKPGKFTIKIVGQIPF